MPVVTVRIFGQGTVRVSSKKASETAYQEIGIASTPESDWTAGFWDTVLFAASPSSGWKLEKMCSRDNKVCKETSMLEAEIDTQYDLLNVYFSQLPPPKEPPPQSDFFMWLWNWFWGRK